MPPIGILLLRKSPPPGPSLATASATLSPSKIPSTAKGAPVTSCRESSPRPRITSENEGRMPQIKRYGARATKKVGFDELQTHAKNLVQHWSRVSKVLRCPVCRYEVKVDSLRKCFDHLVVHLADKALFPYHCPCTSCHYVALTLRQIREHVTRVHKLNWTEKLAASSVHPENKARWDALVDDNCEYGTLVHKSPPVDPPLDAVSAPAASTESPSTSKGTPASSNRQVSHDYGPPPPKVRRQTAQIVNGAALAGVPLNSEQVLMSKNQAKREYAAVLSPSGSTTELPRAAFANLTNTSAVRSSFSARPKRGVVKAPIKDVTSSTSDEDDSADGDFEPGDDQISVDDADVGEISDLDADDLAVGGTASYTGELLSLWRGTLMDSAQVTVFDCPPPRIACCGELPTLKLFHQLDVTERMKFNEAERIVAICCFCGAKPSEAMQDTAGASPLSSHFFGKGWRFGCPRHGCGKSYLKFSFLLDHYGITHAPSFGRLKCTKCKYITGERVTLRNHEQYPHPKTMAEALTMRSVLPGSRPKRIVKWEDPKYCSVCETFFAEFDWNVHRRHHEGDPPNTAKLMVHDINIRGLRAGDKCPFDGCDASYVDFVGWHLHCREKHSVFVGVAKIPKAISSKERQRMPTFRCTSCHANVLIGQVQHHHVYCTASALPETVGSLMKQRAKAYNDEPGLLRLQYGLGLIEERQLMGLLKEATDTVTGSECIENTLLAIRRDPFLRSFVERNRNAPEGNVLYTVAKVRCNTLPGLREWMKEATLYVGSSTGIAHRVGDHIKNSISQWADMGLSLKKDEDLYLFRMSITIDERATVAMFCDADMKRLEQVLIDALDMGTLYNTDRVLASATMLNDFTYRNHIAPRLNQLALVLFESTHKRLSESGIEPDNQYVWKLPLTKTELCNIVRQTSRADVGLVTDSADSSIETERAMHVDRACSPIPVPRILSPEVYGFFTRLKTERDYTDEQMLERIRSWRSENDTLSRTRCPESNESLLPAGESEQFELNRQLSVGSPDLFLDSSELGHVEESSPTGIEHFGFDGVHALERLRATMVDTTTSSHAECPDSEEDLMPAGENARSALLRRHSAITTASFDSHPSSEASTSNAAPVKEASHCLPSPVIGPCALRIPSYGGRSTQYVDLARTPVDLSQDAPSEASHDEPPHELSDKSSESSDEEPPREILDDSSESSLAEPSPTDSGFFDFDNVPATGPTSVIANGEDIADETTPESSAENATDALPSDDVDKGEAGSDTYDQCALKNCRRPQYEKVNWVQCDDCDEWYHSLCITGEEKDVEEDEFHCGCAKTGKRKSSRAHH